VHTILCGATADIKNRFAVRDMCEHLLSILGQLEIPFSSRLEVVSGCVPEREEELPRLVQFIANLALGFHHQLPEFVAGGRTFEARRFGMA
jgi:hypothetical protein